MKTYEMARQPRGNRSSGVVVGTNSSPAGDRAYLGDFGIAKK